MVETIKKKTLKGRKLYIPRMSYDGAKCFAAAFRSIGVDAELSPESDEKTLELGAKYTSGDECYPEKITLGNFLKVVESPDFNPQKTAFFMPTADGPCRFGQYSPFFQKILDDLGYDDAFVCSPTSANGYEGVGAGVSDFQRTGWRALIAGDIIRKLLLKTRPYEKNPGETDEVHEDALNLVCKALEITEIDHKSRLNKIIYALKQAREMFRSIPANFTKDKPLIGIIGEIFCRMNTFSNDDLIRKIEENGAETWISDIGEWVMYTNSEQRRNLKIHNKRFSTSMLGLLIKTHIQKKDEHALYELFHEDFRGYEEPENVDLLLEYSRPYLPREGSLGEMVMNVGKSIYLHENGADGIIDISPFTCMNGIICEAIYPNVSKDYDSIPIRNFYFDGTQQDLDRDIGIFIELVQNYRRKKRKKRVYPDYFG